MRLLRLAGVVLIESGRKTEGDVLTHLLVPYGRHTIDFPKFKIIHKIRTTFWLSFFFFLNLSTISISWLTSRVVADFNFGIDRWSFISPLS